MTNREQKYIYTYKYFFFFGGGGGGGGGRSRRGQRQSFEKQIGINREHR